MDYINGWIAYAFVVNNRANILILFRQSISESIVKNFCIMIEILLKDEFF